MPAVRIALLLLAAFCVACTNKPVHSPDFSAWFEADRVIEIREMARSADCASKTERSVMTYLSSLGALRDWAGRRKIRLSSTSGEPLADSAYVVIELGVRKTGGYGLAVNRQAGLRQQSLVLQATVFEPRQGRWKGTAPSAPCVMISVPTHPYRSIHVIDHNGHSMAAWGDRES